MTNSSSTTSRKALVGWGIRLTLSVVVLSGILWLLPTSEVWAALKRIPPFLWLAVLALFLLGHTVAAAKWWLLTDGGESVAYPRAMRAHFGGLVANLCLPGVAGGDVVRAGLLFGESQNRTRVALGSVADRFLDTVGLMFIAATGAVFAIGDGFFLSGTFVKLALLLMVVIVGALSFMFLLPIVLHRYPNLPLHGLLTKVAKTLGEMRRNPARLLLCFALSVAIQSGFITLNIILARAVGVQIAASAWYFAWPLAKIVAIAPLSVGGLGVREAGLAGLLLPFGAAPAQVVAASLLWQTILYSAGLLGGLALLVSGRLGPAMNARTREKIPNSPGRQ